MRLPRHDTETMPERFEEALRDAFVEAPPAAAEERHLGMIQAAERDARTAPTKPRVPARIRLAAVVAAAILALPIAFAGLALAGVRLPEPVDSAFETVGIDLPNQSGGEDDGDGEEAGEAGGSAQGKSEGGAEPASGAGADGEGGGGNAGGADSAAEETGGSDSKRSQNGAETGSNGPPAHAQDGRPAPPLIRSRAARAPAHLPRTPRTVSADLRPTLRAAAPRRRSRSCPSRSRQSRRP